MAFTGLTPEALLSRSDSKNPATTCKGITTLGRPCRNPLSIDSTNNGVLAVASVVSGSDDEEIGAAAYFCWRHKDQAEKLVAANANTAGVKRQDTQIYPLQGRSSIDTLVARLGVLEVEDSAQERQRRKRRERRPDDRNRKDGNRPPRRVNRPPTWDNVQGPLMQVPNDLMKRRPMQGRPQKKKKGFWESLCCGAADDEEDYVEVVRHKKRVSNAPQMSQYPSEPSSQPAHVPQSQTSRPNGTSASRPTSSIPPRRPLSANSTRPSAKVSTTQPQSETAKLMSYIPSTLPPQTASLLLTELSKPISPHDDEGYIYIFWLTPESAGPAPSSTASTLLAPPSRPEQGRRTSDVLRQYSVRRPQRPDPNRPRRRSAAASNENEDDKNTILLKIGRANNVHRRMNEWTRQCGYSLSLVRFYPYVSSTPTPSPLSTPQRSPAQSRRQSAQNISPGQRPGASSSRRASSSSGVRKVPHAMRVERLIHIELAEQRVMKKCEACGKDHREWFEVDATKEGVKRVDEVVKRWVDWAERNSDS